VAGSHLQSIEKTAPSRSEVLQGTLDLMILKTLEALGPLHGHGIARRIEQTSGDVLQLNEGTIYTGLLLPRLLLFDHPQRPQTACEARRKLGADFGRDRQAASAGSAKVAGRSGDHATAHSAEDQFRGAVQIHLLHEPPTVRLHGMQT
jgi:hypothetical protein